jgi:hypothetical protein
VGEPKSTFQLSHSSKKSPTYNALKSSIIEIEPSNFNKADAKQVWQDSSQEKIGKLVIDCIQQVMGALKSPSSNLLA